MPMVKLLWQRETEGKVFDSPERKAGLDKILREKVKLIRDPSIRAHYGQEIKDLRWELFRPQRKPRAAFQAGGGGQWQGGGGKGKGRWKAAPQPAMPGTRASLLASATEEAQIQMREAVILATAVKTPAIVVQFEQQLEAMECRDPDHAHVAGYGAAVCNRFSQRSK